MANNNPNPPTMANNNPNPPTTTESDIINSRLRALMREVAAEIREEWANEMCRMSQNYDPLHLNPAQQVWELVKRISGQKDMVWSEHYGDPKPADNDPQTHRNMPLEFFQKWFNTVCNKRIPGMVEELRTELKDRSTPIYTIRPNEQPFDRINKITGNEIRQAPFVGSNGTNQHGSSSSVDKKQSNENTQVTLPLRTANNTGQGINHNDRGTNPRPVQNTYHGRQRNNRQPYVNDTRNANRAGPQTARAAANPYHDARERTKHGEDIILTSAVFDKDTGNAKEYFHFFKIGYAFRGLFYEWFMWIREICDNMNLEISPDLDPDTQFYSGKITHTNQFFVKAAGKLIKEANVEWDSRPDHVIHQVVVPVNYESGDTTICKQLSERLCTPNDRGPNNLRDARTGLMGIRIPAIRTLEEIRVKTGCKYECFYEDFPDHEAGGEVFIKLLTKIVFTSWSKVQLNQAAKFMSEKVQFHQKNPKSCEGGGWLDSKGLARNPTPPPGPRTQAFKIEDKFKQTSIDKKTGERQMPTDVQKTVVVAPADVSKEGTGNDSTNKNVDDEKEGKGGIIATSMDEGSVDNAGASDTAGELKPAVAVSNKKEKKDKNKKKEEKEAKRKEKEMEKKAEEKEDEKGNVEEKVGEKVEAKLVEKTEEKAGEKEGEGE